MTEPVIEAANVSKVYGDGPLEVQALTDINLTIKSGRS
jgi:ABC-type lipoprotein export system ATPase subunit